jgi:signal transduction histidine kinase
VSVVIVDATTDSTQSFLETPVPFASVLAALPARPIVLFVVPAGLPEAVERAHLAGADDVIEAPVARPILNARVALALRLYRAERQAREASARDQERTELLDSVVHDMRNPVAVLHANLSWASDHLRRGNPDLIDAVEDCRDETRRMQTILEDLATITRLEREPHPPIREDYISLSELFDDIIRAQARSAEAKRVSLKCSLPVEVRVRGDRQLLRRLVENLVDRALRATPPSGHIHLSARSGANVEISISNLEPEQLERWSRPSEFVSSNTEPSIPHAVRMANPQSIAPASLDRDGQLAVSGKIRVADPSVALERAPADKRRLGTVGLSMYFCRRAAEVHHGEIELDDGRDWPTVLRLKLPAA